MWDDAVRGRLAFWGLFLTILTTLWVLALNKCLESQINYGNKPAEYHWIFDQPNFKL